MRYAIGGGFLGTMLAVAVLAACGGGGGDGGPTPQVAPPATETVVHRFTAAGPFVIPAATVNQSILALQFSVPSTGDLPIAVRVEGTVVTTEAGVSEDPSIRLWIQPKGRPNSSPLGTTSLTFPDITDGKFAFSAALADYAGGDAHVPLPYTGDLEIRLSGDVPFSFSTGFPVSDVTVEVICQQGVRVVEQSPNLALRP